MFFFFCLKIVISFSYVCDNYSHKTCQKQSWKIDGLFMHLLFSATPFRAWNLRTLTVSIHIQRTQMRKSISYTHLLNVNWTTHKKRVTYVTDASNRSEASKHCKWNWCIKEAWWRLFFHTNSSFPIVSIDVEIVHILNMSMYIRVCVCCSANSVL